MRLSLSQLARKFQPTPENDSIFQFEIVGKSEASKKASLLVITLRPFGITFGSLAFEFCQQSKLLHWDVVEILQPENKTLLTMIRLCIALCFPVRPLLSPKSPCECLSNRNISAEIFSL
jgi:hypothetical protein